MKNVFDNDYAINLKDENGNSVVEAIFVVTTTLFMLFLIIMLGFAFYQEGLLQCTADDVATSIARTYSYKRKDPVTGYISKQNLKDNGFIDSAYWLTTGKYTSVREKGKADTSSGGFLSSRSRAEAEEATAMITNLLKKRRFMLAQDYKYEVSIRKSELVAYQNEVTVTITEDYYIPFARLLGVEESVISRSYTGRAICFDLMGSRCYDNVFQVLIKNLTTETKVIKTGVKIVKNITNSAKNTKTTVENLVDLFLDKEEN